MIRYSLIFLLISLAVLLPGINISKKNQFHDNPHDLTVTKGLTGYFSLCILFHHITIMFSQIPGMENEFPIIKQIGVLLVGFFFLFSGYGLIVSYEEKENYMKTFVIRRICTVLLPYFICNYIYMTATLLAGNEFTMKQLILAFFGLILLNDHMWFAVEIMILYMVFFLIFRFVSKEKYKIIFMGLFIILLIVFSFLLGHEYTITQMTWFHGEWWYNTTFLFFLGMLFAKHRKKCLAFAKKHYTPLLLIFTGLFLILWKGTEYMLANYGYWTETPFSKGYTDKLVTLAVQLPMVITFEIWLLLILLKVRVHNRLLAFLGKISLELILLQNVFLLCFEDTFYADFGLYVILSTACTLALAIIINRIKLIILEKK